MKRRLVRIALLGVALAVGGFLVAASGVVPIKASDGHWPITEWFLRFAMKRSIATHSLMIKVPENLGDPALVRKGAGHYDLSCRSCHGEPGMPAPRVAAHMLPRPPELKGRIRASNPKKLFHVVKHGIKLTGMPAWPSEHRDDEVWAMVAFLLKYPALDPTEYRELAGRDEPTAALSVEARPPVSQASMVMAESCARCHSRDGSGGNDGLMPRLAGQRAEYLRHALQAYASGRRHSGIMEPVAAELTAERIAEVAGYYAKLRAPESEEPTSSAASSPAMRESIARGRVIALEGIREQRVPACVECHGPTARRGRPEYPLIAGQPAAYLELQLSLFRDARRGGSEFAHLMQLVASRLKPEQARDAARYFSSLPGGAEERPTGRGN